MITDDRLAALIEAAQAVLAASNKYTFGPTMEKALARLDAASDAAGVRVAPSPDAPGQAAATFIRALQPWREASRRLIANGDDDEGSAT